MMRVIDKEKGYVVQKVTDRKGSLIRYQVVPANGPTEQHPMMSFPRLGEAREFIKNSAPVPTKTSVPLYALPNWPKLWVTSNAAAAAA